jgi:hypothetical protein
MGLDTADDRRNTLQRTSLMWGESTALLLVVGLSAGCTFRPEAPNPTATAPAAKVDEAKVDEAKVDQAKVASIKAPPTLNPLVGEVTATESADGHTHLQLTPLPDVQAGDIIRIKAAERIIATALVTTVSPTSLSALVTGLSDRTRPVLTGDRATQLFPAELLPPPGASEAHAAETQHAAAHQPAVEAHVAAVEPAPTAPAHAALASDNHPEEHAADSHATDTLAVNSHVSGKHSIHVEAAAVTGPVAVKSSRVGLVPGAPREVASVTAPVAAMVATGAATGAAAAESVPPLNPEMRARLNAERAYFELASRILRLPAANPELLELQERVRAELAEVELAP